MRISTALLALAFASPVAFAQSVHLKCDIDKLKGDGREERWMEVDKTHNLLRDGGISMQLVITNDVYGGITEPVAGFRTKYEINRNTGDVLITEFFERTVKWELGGTCNKSEPPKKKF